MRLGYGNIIKVVNLKVAILRYTKCGRYMQVQS